MTIIPPFKLIRAYDAMFNVSLQCSAYTQTNCFSTNFYAQKEQTFLAGLPILITLYCMKCNRLVKIYSFRIRVIEQSAIISV